jgi:murein L,D-transpeptidase YcbB/YkuD
MSRIVMTTLAAATLTGLSLSAAAAEQSWIEETLAKQRAERGVAQGRAGFPATNSYAAKSVLASRQTIRQMDAAIGRYQAIHRSGGWPSIPGGRILRHGDDNERVARLRLHLAATADLAKVHARRHRTVFDGYVKRAVRRFQKRHGLSPTGVANRHTLAALNVSSAQRLNQLIQNRHRLRVLLTKTTGRRYVLVNIPAYELQAIRAGRVEVYGRIVVGKASTPTPVLTAKIRGLNTLPYWHVPQSIVQRQLIPSVKKDSHFLARQKIRVFPAGRVARSTRAQSTGGPRNRVATSSGRSQVLTMRSGCSGSTCQTSTLSTCMIRR